jgi:hypothetical protein
MRKFFRISGYWKDDKTEFSDLIVTDFDDVVEELDDQIFHYGLTEEDLKTSSEDDALEFVVTSYEDVTEDFTPTK